MPRLPPVTRATFPLRSIFTPASPPTSLCLHEARHLIGGSQGGDARPRGDALQQPPQDVARSDLPETRAPAPQLGGALHTNDPAHPRRQLVAQPPARPIRFTDRLRGPPC